MDLTESITSIVVTYEEVGIIDFGKAYLAIEKYGNPVCYSEVFGGDDESITLTPANFPNLNTVYGNFQLVPKFYSIPPGDGGIRITQIVITIDTKSDLSNLIYTKDRILMTHIFEGTAETTTDDPRSCIHYGTELITLKLRQQFTTDAGSAPYCWYCDDDIRDRVFIIGTIKLPSSPKENTKIINASIFLYYEGRVPEPCLDNYEIGIWKLSNQPIINTLEYNQSLSETDRGLLGCTWRARRGLDAGEGWSGGEPSANANGDNKTGSTRHEFNHVQDGNLNLMRFTKTSLNSGSWLEFNISKGTSVNGDEIDVMEWDSELPFLIAIHKVRGDNNNIGTLEMKFTGKNGTPHDSTSPLGYIAGAFLRIEYSYSKPTEPSELEVEAIEKLELDDSKTPNHTGFVKLMWKKPDNVDGFDRYVIYRSTSENLIPSACTEVGQITDFELTEFIDRTDLTEETYYYYKVVVYNITYSYASNVDGGTSSNEVKIWRPKVYSPSTYNSNSEYTFNKVNVGCRPRFSEGENVNAAKIFKPAKYLHVDWGDDSWSIEELNQKRISASAGTAKTITLDNTIGFEVGDYVCVYKNAKHAAPDQFIKYITEKTQTVLTLNSIFITLEATTTEIPGGCYVFKCPAHIYSKSGTMKFGISCILENGYRSKITTQDITVLPDQPICNLNLYPPKVYTGKYITFDVTDSDSLDENMDMEDSDGDYRYEFITDDNDYDDAIITDIQMVDHDVPQAVLSYGIYYYRFQFIDANGKEGGFSNGKKLDKSTETHLFNIQLTVTAPANGTLRMFKSKNGSYELLENWRDIACTTGTNVIKDTWGSGTGTMIYQGTKSRTSAYPYWRPVSPTVSVTETRLAKVRVRNYDGDSAWENLYPTTLHQYFSGYSKLDYEVFTAPTISLYSLTDGFQTDKLGAGRETSADMHFDDEAIAVSNIRKLKTVSVDGKAFTRSTPHPIAVVDTWADSIGGLIGTIPDDIITMMYLEENKSVVSFDFEGRTVYFIPTDIPRDREAGTKSIWTWTLNLLETGW
jgi:hypothetical protein